MCWYFLRVFHSRSWWSWLFLEYSPKSNNCLFTFFLSLFERKWCESCDYSIRSRTKCAIIFDHAGINLKCYMIESLEDESIQRSDTRKCDVSLPRNKCIREIHDCRVKCHSLWFMDRDRPSKTKGYLSNRSLDSSIFLDWPVHSVSSDWSPIKNSDDRKSLKYSCNMTNGTIRISSFKIILHKHDSSSLFENKSFWCKASLFERFNEFFRSLWSHLIDHSVIMNLIESISIVFIDRYIPSEKLCMIVCLDSDISRREKILRLLWYISWTNLVQDCEKWLLLLRIINSQLSIINSLSILCRQCTDSERKCLPRTMFKGKLWKARSSWNWWKLEKISDKHDLNSSKWFWRDSRSLKKQIKWSEECSWEHRYLIDDKNWRLRKSLHEVFSAHDIFEIFTCETFSYSHTTPGMDSHSSDMCRGNSSRSRDCHTYSVFVTISNKAIDEKCLSTSCSTSEKYIVPHRKYVKSLILNHADECMKKGMKDNKKSSKKEDLILINEKIFWYPFSHHL